MLEIRKYTGKICSTEIIHAETWPDSERSRRPSSLTHEKIRSHKYMVIVHRQISSMFVMGLVRSVKVPHAEKLNAARNNAQTLCL